MITHERMADTALYWLGPRVIRGFQPRLSDAGAANNRRTLELGRHYILRCIRV